jgi:hypothetical protein
MGLRDTGHYTVVADPALFGPLAIESVDESLANRMRNALRIWDSIYSVGGLACSVACG